MTLRQQFDDIMDQVLDLANGGEEEFIDTVARAMEFNVEGKRIEEERKTLEKIVAKKERQLAKRRAEFKKLSVELEGKKKEIGSVQKEKRAAEKVLEDVRRAVHQRKNANTTSAEILSLIESASLSNASEEWETALNE